MPVRLALAQAFLLALAACAPSFEGEELAEPGPDYAAHRSAIVGGTIDTGDPAVVALAVGTQSQYCTGTLIAPKTILTAAHCVNSYGTEYPYYALFGTYAGSPDFYVEVVEQKKHPQYNGGSRDLGVLRLARAVTNVTPISLNPVALGYGDQGKPIRHVGFGITSGGGGGGGTKRQVSYSVREIRSYTIESGGNGKQTCSGDSGGPAFMVTQGSTAERVVGVVSYGDPDCTQFGADARVDPDINWIKSTYAAWEAPSCDTDGKCVPGCAPIDQDCACASDGACSPQCLDLTRDPDCPKDCVKNGVCALESCPTPDLDCVPEGGLCVSEVVCKSRLCVRDQQHTSYYCTRSCKLSAECPLGTECSNGACIFVQKPEVKLGQSCTPQDYCRGGVCSGPSESERRCAVSCGSSLDCPQAYSCEGGFDGVRYCYSKEVVVQPNSGRSPVTLPRISREGPAAQGCASILDPPSWLWALGLLLFRPGPRRRD